MSVIARIFGVSATAVRQWVKKGACGAVAAPAPPGTAATVRGGAYAELGTYRQARHGDKRQDWWSGTAVAADPGGWRAADFEVGDRGANTFQRLYARLPEAELYQGVWSNYEKRIQDDCFRHCRRRRQRFSFSDIREYALKRPRFRLAPE